MREDETDVENVESAVPAAAVVRMEMEADGAEDVERGGDGAGDRGWGGMNDGEGPSSLPNEME
jgi:hypothetical protein